MKFSSIDKIPWEILIFKGRKEIPKKFQVFLNSAHPDLSIFKNFTKAWLRIRLGLDLQKNTSRNFF